MYELYKLGDDLYQIHSTFYGEKAMEGNLASIMTYAVKFLQFDINELEVALVDMLQNDKDAANFGINRMFIYSFNRSTKYGKVG